MKIKKILLLLALSASFASCAHKDAKKSIEEKVDQVSNVEVKDFQEDAKKSIQDSENLTVDQKAKLIAVDEKLTLDQKKIVDELNKSKVILVELICQRDMNKSEYKALKNKIVDLNKQKVKNGFEAAQKVRKILFPKKEMQTSVKLEDQKKLEMYHLIYRHHLREL